MKRAKWPALFTATAVVLADQLSKWAADALPETGVRLFQGLSLVRFLNPHLAGSLPLPETLIIAAAFGALALTAAALWRSFGSRRTLQPIGWALILGGGLSNLGDRLVRGGVLDIFRIGPISYVNLADAAILAGIALILIKSTKHPNRLSEERV